jgi:RNA polymerase sigma-70 factor (ECF subfamily)
VAYSDDSPEGRFLAGEPEAVALVSRWVASVLAAPRFWHLRAEWVDTHQEVLRRVLESLREDRYDPAQELRAYVLATARYTALQALWRRRRDPAAGRLAIDLDSDSPAAGSLGHDARIASLQLARLALEGVGAACRALLRAYFYEGRSYAEIASSLGVPLGTVKSRVSRCLESAHRVLAGSSRAGGRPLPAPGEHR